MPRRAGGIRRKKRTHKASNTNNNNNEIVKKEEETFVPSSFVIRRGQVPTGVRDLVEDIRLTLMPNTALKLKERKLNNLKDYLSLASYLKVSHLWILSATSISPYLRLCTIPQGPTLTFRIVEYSLIKDIKHIQKRPILLTPTGSTSSALLNQSPLLVMNNFNTCASKENEFVSQAFKYSFPCININQIKLSNLKRVLLIHKDLSSNQIYIRHYVLKIKKANLSKSIKKIIHKQKIPNMNSLQDVSQIINDEINMNCFSSDSEIEQISEQQAKVHLNSSLSTSTSNNKNANKGGNSVIKLVEVGPRLTLSLMKIQAGVCEGGVLYHATEKKSNEEIELMQQRFEKQKELKKRRREEQEENVRKKDDVKKAKKERRKSKMEQRLKAMQEDEDNEHDSDDDDDDDVDVDDVKDVLHTNNDNQQGIVQEVDDQLEIDEEDEEVEEQDNEDDRDYEGDEEDDEGGSDNNVDEQDESDSE